MNNVFDRRRGDKLFSTVREYQICTQCIMDTSDHEITFDDHGICNHCRDYDAAVHEAVIPAAEGWKRLEEFASQVKEANKKKPYDSVIGLSGGVDSSYVAYLVRKKLGLRPLGVHLDNGWNSELAVRNIESIVKALEIDLHTVVLDWDEFRGLQLAFLRASTPDSEIPTDHAIVSSLYWTAVRNKLEWVIEGSNIVTEAMVPPTWSHGHGDWRYIRTVNSQFGGKPLKTYPHYSDFDRRIRFESISPVRRFQILNYVDYDKKEAMATLEREFNWVPYGGKHYESIYTRFFQGYILPTKFGFDKRRPHLSCLVRSGQMTREKALGEIQKPPIPEALEREDRAFVIKKLGITEREFEQIMDLPKRTFWDYPSYERHPPKLPVYLADARAGIQRLPRRAVVTGRIAVNKAINFGMYPTELSFSAKPKRVGPLGGPIGERRVCIFSFTPATDEPRVRRQASAFLDHGYHVTVVGLAGGRSPHPDGWDIIFVQPSSVPASKLRLETFDLMKKGAKWLPALAERYYWRAFNYDEIFHRVSNVRANVVLANDYYTAPLAARLAARNGVPFAVDCHEYARSQYMHDPNWVENEREWIHGLQRTLYPRAAVITTVCEGIAELLQRDYGLQKKPTVIRSTPPYVEMPFRATGEVIEVLYHGILAHARGLEAAIESVKSWRPEFRLIIRGHGPEDYVESLKALAAKHGVAERVSIPGAVPFSQLIPAANQSDIGFFVQADISEQKRFTLPNKLFEYIMAGLAICVADLPEMARVVREHEVGLLVPDATPTAIAATINRLDRAMIDAFKRKSLQAARVLCWENESREMTDAFAVFDPELAVRRAPQRQQTARPGSTSGA
ncbi:MAG: N-acetyl sugar amidotransferase [Deltaproteobacteria bacterium]|nr:N-acetyl sugar amidotransferase [Deltaproteobacteria bacterium]